MYKNKTAEGLMGKMIMLFGLLCVGSVFIAAFSGAFSTPPTPPHNIHILPTFIEPSSINVTITNYGPTAIYPENLLINGETVWPIVVIENLSVGNSKVSLVNYNWTYDTDYRFVLIFLDAHKEESVSIGYYSPIKTQFISMAIPDFENADWASWSLTFDYGQHYSTGTLTHLPANITIDVTYMVTGIQLYVRVYYYQSQVSSFFKQLGQQDYLVIVPNFNMHSSPIDTGSRA